MSLNSPKAEPLLVKAKQPYVPPPDEMHWLTAALLSTLCFTIYNYWVGTRQMSAYGLKVLNSASAGVFGLGYLVFQLHTKHTEFLRVFYPSSPVLLYAPEPTSPGRSTVKRVIHKGVILSALCGLLLAGGTTFLYLGFQEATSHEPPLNISIITSINSSSSVFALIASYFIYKDNISIMQTFGAVLNLTGVLVISLFGSGELSSNFLMVVFAAICAIMLGLRILISKHCCLILDAKVYMQVNYIADFAFGVVLLVFGLVGLYALSFPLVDSLTVFAAGFFSSLAEMFLFIAIERGVAGSAVSLVSSNTVLVMFLNWGINGATPSTIQAVGISGSFLGIVIISLGDVLIKGIKNFMKSGDTEDEQKSVDLVF